MRVDCGGHLGYRLSLNRPVRSGVSVSLSAMDIKHTMKWSRGAAGEARINDQTSNDGISNDRTRYCRLVLRDRILRHRRRVLPDQDRQLALTTGTTGVAVDGRGAH